MEIELRGILSLSYIPTPSLFFMYIFLNFEIGFHQIAKDSLKLEIVLSQPPE